MISAYRRASTKKSTLLAWLLTCLLLLSGVVHAEGECPPGMFPTNPPGTQGPVGCAPIPGYNNQQQAQPQPPPPRWVDHWGAIATYEPNGSFGAVTNLSTQSQAEQTALAECQSKKKSTCRIEISYRNQCAALVASDKGYNTTSGTTTDEAIQKGMKICKDAGNQTCFSYYSACSLPVRIQ